MHTGRNRAPQTPDTTLTLAILIVVGAILLSIFVSGGVRR